MNNTNLGSPGEPFVQLDRLPQGPLKKVLYHEVQGQVPGMRSSVPGGN